LTINTRARLRKIAELSPEELKSLVIELIQDRKGKSIVSLDMRKIPEAITDYFVVCSGDSTTQVRAIVEHLEEEVRNRTGLKPLHTEGTIFGEWALIDFGDVIVHAFIPEKREYYQLEELWHDATTENIPDLQ
jgi:ribosome-associated protein